MIHPRVAWWGGGFPTVLPYLCGALTDSGVKRAYHGKDPLLGIPYSGVGIILESASCVLPLLCLLFVFSLGLLRPDLIFSESLWLVPSEIEARRVCFPYVGLHGEPVKGSSSLIVEPDWGPGSLYKKNGFVIDPAVRFPFPFQASSSQRNTRTCKWLWSAKSRVESLSFGRSLCTPGFDCESFLATISVMISGRHPLKATDMGPVPPFGIGGAERIWLSPVSCLPSAA